jgi:hypothetical protein
MECDVEVHQLLLGERQEEALEEDNGFAKTGIEVVMGGIEQVPLAFGPDRGRIVQLFGGIGAGVIEILHEFQEGRNLVEKLRPLT